MSNLWSKLFQPRSKPEIALQEFDRVRALGVRFGLVLADAGYGLSASFRQGLSAGGLTWAVGIPKHQKVYLANVALVFPVPPRIVSKSPRVLSEGARCGPLFSNVRAIERTLSRSLTPSTRFQCSASQRC